MKAIPILLPLALIAAVAFSCKKNNLAEAWQVAQMQVQMAEVNGSISKLEQADEALKGDIKALEQMAARLQTDIESAEGDIAAFRAKAQEKLDSVNTVLNGLKAKDAALEGQMASLRDWASETFTTKEQYAATMTEITTVKENINTLCTSLAGLTTSVTQLQTTLAEVQAQLLSLLGRVEELEDNFAGLIARIQSVVVLPDYADGSVSCSSGDNYFQFEVFPSGTAGLLAQAPLTAYTMKAMYTKTKAPSFVSLPISAVEADGDILIVTASGAQLSSEFFSGTVPANAALQIQSESGHYSTAYFPLHRASAAPSPQPFDVETDLSAAATANCYVVAAAGRYKFKADVKGNSTTTLDGTPSSAALLWESFGTSTAPSENDIIASLSYEDGYVKFETPSTLQNGNAVIAVKDASGNILWSWHIWVCAGYDPIATSQVYYNDAGVMMDRNLGATSATPGDVGALGLLYQWGRKDPFLGSSSISSSILSLSTLSWPAAVSSSSSVGTVAYATAHPTTFIKSNSSRGDWIYSSKDNTLWKSSKSIYDPCPPGWKVPKGGDAGVWSQAVGSNSDFSYSWNSFSKGMNFFGMFGHTEYIWFPAAGYYDGNLNIVGTAGKWWSFTPRNDNAYRLWISDTGRVHLSLTEVGGSRADGLSVRCLQE